MSRSASPTSGRPAWPRHRHGHGRTHGPPASGGRGANSASDLTTRAADLLVEAFGPGGELAVAACPGRCTLVGEHVDYADGVVVATAVDRHVAVALRRSTDGWWRLASGDRREVRSGPLPEGSFGDRLFAAAVVWGRTGVDIVPLEIAAVADLPAGAGLASSAAVAVATLLALSRLEQRTVTEESLVALALEAEREVVGVPCGPLDQTVVVRAPRSGVLCLDVRTNVVQPLPELPGDVTLVACVAAPPHDVGGEGYRTRRREVDEALRLLGARSWREVTDGDLRHLPPLLGRRARHVLTETERARAAADALRRGDLPEVGRLMTASHRSLRDDFDVSTPELDAAVGAALAIRGCLGARLVGAGFGGTVVALVERGRGEVCLAAMRGAVGGRAPGWILRPTPGVAVTAADVVAASPHGGGRASFWR